MVDTIRYPPNLAAKDFVLCTAAFQRWVIAGSVGNRKWAERCKCKNRCEVWQRSCSMSVDLNKLIYIFHRNRSVMFYSECVSILSLVHTPRCAVIVACRGRCRGKQSSQLVKSVEYTPYQAGSLGCQ